MDDENTSSMSSVESCDPISLSSVESLNPHSLSSVESVESVPLSPITGHEDQPYPHPYQDPDQMGRYNEKCGTNSIDLPTTEYTENESWFKDQLDWYRTQSNDAVMVIAILLWTAVHHHPSQTESPPRGENIAYFKFWVDKFRSRIPTALGNCDRLREARKQAEELLAIFTNEVKAYVPATTSTKDNNPDNSSEHTEFLRPEPEGPSCPPTVPSKMHNPPEENKPRKTKDENLSRFTMEHKPTLGFGKGQMANMVRPPPKSSKRKPDDFNTAINMPGTPKAGIFGAVGSDEADGDVPFANENLNSTVIYNQNALREAKQSDRKQGDTSVTVSNLSTSIDTSDERDSSDAKTETDQNTSPKTTHSEYEEINVKLDVMFSQLEELKVTIRNASAPQHVGSNISKDTFSKAVYIKPGTNFLAMVNEERRGEDEAKLVNQQLKSTDVCKPNTPRDVERPDEDESGRDKATTQRKEGSSPDDNTQHQDGTQSSTNDLSGQNMDDDVAAPITAHVEKEKTNVKLRLYVQGNRGVEDDAPRSY